MATAPDLVVASVHGVGGGGWGVVRTGGQVASGTRSWWHPAKILALMMTGMREFWGDGDGRLSEAVGCLRGGGLVAFPTETVYGLGADALNSEAVRGVFRLKGRPASNPLIVHVDSAEMARGVAGGWSGAVDRLVRAFWPGPLTVVVPRGVGVPDEVTAGGGTVAVRCPDHPVALALIGAFGGPIVGPSANRSGAVSPTRAEHVFAEFGEAVADGRLMVLDGGACRAGIESSVVEVVPGFGGGCDGDVIGVRVLRPGVIGRAEIERALFGGDAGGGVKSARVVWLDDGVGGDERGEGWECGKGREGGVERSPGRVGAHYRPRSAVVLVGDASSAVGFLRERGARGLWAAVVSKVGADVGVAGEGGVSKVVRLPADAGGYASGLYHALREADAGEPGLIVVVGPWSSVAGVGGGAEEGVEGGSASIWEAVRERLGRCAAGGGG